MNDYKEMDNLVFEFGKDIKFFANNYSGTMPPEIRTQLQDFMYTGFSKEIEAITQQEKLEIRYKKKFYNKLLRAKTKLVKSDRADAWYDKVFQNYFNRGILEHLIVYAIKFLYRKDLFVSKRLFAQVNDDELLVQFTAAACEYLGWTSQNEATEEPVTLETETINEEQETTETEVNKDAEPQTDEVEQSFSQEEQARVEDSAEPETETDKKVETNPVAEPAASLQSTKELPSFYRPGGKSGTN